MKIMSLTNRLKTALFALCAFAMFSCVNGEEFEAAQVDETPGYEKVFTSPNCNFYKAQFPTRGTGEATGIITLPNNPSVVIYTYENTNPEEGEYAHKAVFVKDGVEMFEFYSSVDESEDGYVFSYNCINGDMDSVFLPKGETRAAAKPGDDNGGIVDCIADAYMNDGWASVFAWCATAVCWEVAAAIAVDCMIH